MLELNQGLVNNAMIQNARFDLNFANLNAEESIAFLSEAKILMSSLPEHYKIRQVLSEKIEKFEVLSTNRLKGTLQAEALIVKLKGYLIDFAKDNLSIAIDGSSIDPIEVQSYLNNESISKAVRIELEKTHSLFEKRKQAYLTICKLLDQFTVDFIPKDPIAIFQDFVSNQEVQITEQIGKFKELFPKLCEDFYSIKQAWCYRLLILFFNENFYNANKIKEILDQFAHRPKLIEFIGDVKKLTKYPRIKSDARIVALLKVIEQHEEKVEEMKFFHTKSSKFILDFMKILQNAKAKPIDKVFERLSNIIAADMPSDLDKFNLLSEFQVQYTKEQLFVVHAVLQIMGILNDLDKYKSLSVEDYSEFYKLGQDMIFVPPLTMEGAIALRERFDLARKHLSYLSLNQHELFICLKKKLSSYEKLENQLICTDLSKSVLYNAIEDAELYLKIIKEFILSEKPDNWTLSTLQEAECLYGKVLTTVERLNQNDFFKDSFINKFLNGFMGDLDKTIESHKNTLKSLIKEFETIEIQITSLLNKSFEGTSLMLATEFPKLALAPKWDSTKEPLLEKELRHRLNIIKMLEDFRVNKHVEFCISFFGVKKYEADEHISQTKAKAPLAEMKELLFHPLCPSLLKKELQIIVRSYALERHPKQESLLETKPLLDAVYIPSSNKDVLFIYNFNELESAWDKSLKSQQKIKQYDATVDDEKYKAKVKEKYIVKNPQTGQEMPNYFESAYSITGNEYVTDLLKYFTSQLVPAKEIQLLVADYKSLKKIAQKRN